MRFARRRSVPFLALIPSLVACGGGDGGQLGPVVQLGDNLNQIPAISNVTCADGFPVQINATFPQPFTSQGAGSCLLLTFFPGAQPTTPGRVVSANIQVGAVTGPMRFVKMRILVQNIFVPPNGVEPDKACCSVEQYGAVFTPTPNSVTTVPLDFDMVADRIPPANDLSTIAAADLVGLEVLAPNVPIPGVWVNNGGAVLTLPNYLWLPAMSVRPGSAAPTQNLRSEGSYSGFLPSYNLNFRAAAGVGATSPTEP
ncbi:MAG: hypothetical protein AB7T31_10955 [Gemmatimonadales bacterium]